MGRLILAIGAFVLAIAVLKMVIVAIFIAGFIFRTREAIGLLLLWGLIALINAHPIIGLPVLGFVVIAAIVMANNKTKQQDASEAPKLLK